MVRNESVGRVVMLLCFGTAFLSLAVHWRITTAERQSDKSASTAMRRDSTLTNPKGSRPEGVYKNLSQVSLGEIALGASVPIDEATQGTTAQRVFTPKSSAVKPQTKVKVIKKKNVAKATKSKIIKKNLAKATNVGAIVPQTQPQIIKKDVAKETELPAKTRLVAQTERQNSVTDSWPKSIWSQASAQQVPSNKLADAKTQVVVDLSDRRTYVYAGDEVIASYPIAVGKKGWETPTGSFQVIHMRHYPIWRHPITGKVFEAGTDSPLGDRWIGFWSDGRNEIGFHGTPEIDLIGTAVSHGCLRMRNSDVRLLYEQVSLGTKVLVRD
ncbi:ErfK/YbiS/YcfS/YnhG family protein [Nostoc commune NIES-4072]|uniref:ErfK/YbiS/YcfS/YnhG family protein n=1 Tax=Nostoc commune NIES-4072 TaxID=2005467 RepID=A0A2R5FHJ5_NOSCO|nr:ErfK/YbiS/YcfS/YnhG family protein [Nostoc commune HK-02]GBG18132.1 ErfK/YbiS/YcfS/YnhG family protein [Nostoc commune NIES-4072]